MWYLYITENQNGDFYTGITTNLSTRFLDHLKGRDGDYTGKNRPNKLVYSEEFIDPGEARGREKQIKGWSRAKKLALIYKDLETLKRLSRSKD